MYSLRLFVFLLGYAVVLGERRVKIGFMVGPESSRREGSDKFWSFAQPLSSQMLLEPITYRLPRWGAKEIATAACDAAVKGARGLIVLCPRRLSSLADAYSSRLRLPLVSPWGGDGALHAGVLPETTGAAADVLGDAETFAFLYDTETGADRLSTVLSTLQGRSAPAPFVEGFWRVHGVNDSLSFLRTLPTTTDRVLVDTVEEELAENVFRGVSREIHGVWMGPAMGLDKKVRLPNRSTLTRFQVSSSEGVSLGGLENRWKTLEDRRGGEKDMPPSAVLTHDSIRVMYSMLDQLGAEWLDSNLGPQDTDCFNYTAGVPEGTAMDMTAISGAGVTGPLKFNEDGKRTDYVLNIVETSNYGPRKIGKWSEKSGLKLDTDRRRQTMPVAERQRSDPPIRVTSIEVRPFLQKRSTGGYEGYAVDLVDELRRVTGRNMQLQIVADGRYGYLVDGRWVGMIGELVDNVTDLVIAPLTKTPFRSTSVLFGKTFMTVGISVVVSKPQPKDHQTTSGPLFPFAVWSPWQWALIVLLVLLTAALGGAASRFVGVPDRVRALETKGKDGLSPCGSLWLTCGALLGRDTGIYPRSITHRVLTAGWWFLCFVFAVTYIASLSAELVRNRNTLVTTHTSKTSQQLLADFLQKGSPVIGTIRSGSTPSFFRNSDADSLYREYGQYIDRKPEVLVANYSEGFRRVRDGAGEFAFLAESISAEFEANQAPCDLLLTSGYLATRSYAPATRLDNPILRDIVDHAILNLTADGVLRDLYEKWWHNFTDYCEDPNLNLMPKTYSSSLTVFETSGAFVVLILGCVVAAIAAFIENYIASMRVTFLD